MRLSQIRDFVAVVESGGIRAAARKLGVSPTAATMVPEAITRFRQQFPQSRVHIAEGLPQLLLPLVRDETLDFAICRRAVVKLDSGLAFRPLFRNDFLVVARKGHPLQKADSLAQL